MHVKRVYDPPDPDDGHRILVDRLWPRGLTRQAAAVDEWLRDLAPSRELLRWYGHDRARFDDFAGRYRAELTRGPQAQALRRLRTLAEAGPYTVLTASRDLAHAHTAVLAVLLGGERDEQHGAR